MDEADTAAGEYDKPAVLELLVMVAVGAKACDNSSKNAMGSSCCENTALCDDDDEDGDGVLVWKGGGASGMIAQRRGWWGW